MRLYPETYLTTDGIYDRSHRLYTELLLAIIAFPMGFIAGVLLTYNKVM